MNTINALSRNRAPLQNPTNLGVTQHKEPLGKTSISLSLELKEHPEVRRCRVFG